jgi:ketosteroid isomerase-like protein
MRRKATMKKILLMAVTVVVALAWVPAVSAQTPTVEELLTEFYKVLNAALASGDTSALLEWYADDATMEVAALAPAPVTGKEMIGAAMLPGMLSAVGGATITTLAMSVEGNTATVYNMYTGGVQGDFPIQEIIVFTADGKIQTYTVNVGVTPPAAQPAALPQTGGAVGSLLPLLLMASGGVLVGLGRRFRAR